MLLFVVIAVSAMCIQCASNKRDDVGRGVRGIRDLSYLALDEIDDSIDDSDTNAANPFDAEAEELKSKAMYEKMKTIMKYDPSNDEKMNGYTFVHDYQIDNDDVKTLSQTAYDEWPVFFHTPSYDHNLKDKINTEKAKDKRFILDKSTDQRESIPVCEDTEESDEPTKHKLPLPETSRRTRGMNSDNPFEGEQPFLSFVLSDIDNTDRDALHFKGISWDSSPDIKHSSIPKRKSMRNSAHIKDVINDRGYDNRHDLDRREKAHKIKSNHHADYKNAGNQYKGHKDVSDSFSNRYDKHDKGKDSNFKLKESQDKAHKKKGFHKVYHKDEYMLNDEFYDNNKKSAKAVERGHDRHHKGGSKASVSSRARADIGEDTGAYHNHGNRHRDTSDRRYKGHNTSRGKMSDYNNLRDLAKEISASNIGDYIDHVDSYK